MNIRVYAAVTYLLSLAIATFLPLTAASDASAQTNFGIPASDDWDNGFIGAVFNATETISTDTFASLGGSGGPATTQLTLGSHKGHGVIPTGGIQTPNRVTPGSSGPLSNTMIFGWQGGNVEQVTLTLFDFDPGESLSNFSVVPDSATGGTLASGVFTGNANNANSVLTWNNLNRSLLSFTTNAGSNGQLDTMAWSATPGSPRILDFTDFNAANPGPEMPLTDGQQPGFNTPNSLTGAGDTFAGWTWYTEQAADQAPDAPGDVINPISVPFGGGTEMVAEQAIRNGTNQEIDSSAPTSFFNLRWDSANGAVALRKTYENVGDGTANVDWIESDNLSGGLFGYYSQDDGLNWMAMMDGVDFQVDKGTLDLLLVGNDGADTADGVNGGLELIAVSLPARVPEPESLAVWSLLGLACMIASLRLGRLGRRTFA